VTLFFTFEAVLVSALAIDLGSVDVLSSFNDDITLGARSDLSVAIDELTLVMRHVFIVHLSNLMRVRFLKNAP
jgi:hypothetical protein